MKKLLNFEFRKLVRQKSFYVCNIILLGLIFLSALMSKAIFDNIENVENVEQTLPTASNMLQSSLTGGNLPLIIGIFVALFTCEDYTDGIIKNIYAKGYSRIEVYFSKLIAVCIFSAVACLVSIVVSFASGLVLFDIGSGMDAHAVLVLATQVFVIVFGYTTMFFTISTILKKTGGSIAGCIVAPMVVSLVFGMADSFLHNNNIKFANYWLDGIFESIAKAPSDVTRSTLISAVVISAAYAIVCIAIGIKTSKRQEI